MKVRSGIVAGALLSAMTLSACDDKNAVPKLMNIRSATRSPDEFRVLPTKPLTMPDDLAQLPAPTPGGANLTDPTPEADAVVALGGNASVVTPGTGISAGSQGLISYASRYGRSDNIRQTLAAEDLEYRRKHNGRLLERVFSLNVYFRAYRPMSLDSYAELERWRRAGAQTVGAPPKGTDLKKLKKQ